MHRNQSIVFGLSSSVRGDPSAVTMETLSQNNTEVLMNLNLPFVGAELRHCPNEAVHFGSG